MFQDLEQGLVDEMKTSTDIVLSEGKVELTHLISAVQFSYITQNEVLGSAVSDVIKLILELDLEKEVSAPDSIISYLHLIQLEVNPELTSLAYDCF